MARNSVNTTEKNVLWKSKHGLLVKIINCTYAFPSPSVSKLYWNNTLRIKKYRRKPRRIKNTKGNKNSFSEDGKQMGTELMDSVKLNYKPAIEKAAKYPSLVPLATSRNGGWIRGLVESLSKN